MLAPRPEVSVHYEPARPRPGDELVVDVDLRCEARTKLNAVRLSLRGTETLRPELTDALPVHLVAELAGRVLTPGLHTLTARFTLPHDAPPSLWVPDASVEYVLRVHLDIPWAFDVEKDFVIPVEPPLAPDPPIASPPVRANVELAYDQEQRIEASLAQTAIAAGQVLSGQVDLQGYASSDTADVDVAFESFVRKRLSVSDEASGWRRRARAAYFEAEAHRDHAIGDGHIPFQVGLPIEARPTCQGWLFRHEWEVVVSVRARSGPVGTIRIPILVLGSPDTPDTEKPPADVRRVGPARRAQAWAAVARSHGLAHDVESERLSTTLADVQLDITTEDDLTVATLKWPPLGLDLELRRRPEVVEDPMETGDRHLDTHLSVRARRRAQAVTFLRQIAPGLLHLHDERLHLDDQGARLSVGGTAHDEAALWHFTDRAKTLAEEVARALPKVPPPPGFARFVAGWRSWSERLGGRLETGRMWIHEGRWNETTVSIGTTWSGEGEGIATGTVVRLGVSLPLQERIDARAGAAALPPGVKKLLSSLAADVSQVAFDPTGIEITLARVVLDPEDVVPFLDWLAKLGAGFRTSGAFR